MKGPAEDDAGSAGNRVGSADHPDGTAGAEGRLHLLRTRLCDLEHGPEPRPAADDVAERSGRRQAAVSVILRVREDVDILLIKRAELEGDPWSGHMALPGGRREPQDETLLATAVRETMEETGILLDASQPLGRLTQLRPSSPHIPPLLIQPYVFGVDPTTEGRVASPEVTAVHWVPLASLEHPAVQGSLQIRLDRSVRTFPSFEVEGETVWGLTYRVLTELLEAYGRDGA